MVFRGGNKQKENYMAFKLAQWRVGTALNLKESPQAG